MAAPEECEAPKTLDMPRPRPLKTIEIPEWLRPVYESLAGTEAGVEAETGASVMSIDQLRQPSEWAGRNPEEIREAVIAHGGWVKVFPQSEYKEFPLWASRVRNFFNTTPTELMLVSDAEAERQMRAEGLDLMSRADKGFNATLGFTGDVYRDETGRHWFEMRAAGAIYHYEGEVSDNKNYKIWEAVALGQKSTPVFKLISPDGTGGSMEVVVHNWQHHEGKSQIGNEGERVNIRSKVVINEIYRGSYNYSETGVTEQGEHDFRDVDSHEAQYGFYVNPPGTQSDAPLPSEDEMKEIEETADKWWLRLGG